MSGSGQRMIKASIKSQTSEQQQKDLQENQLRLKNIVMLNLLKKQSSGVSFSGIIKSGVFKDDDSLSIMYCLSYGKNWSMIAGQPSGISFKSQAAEGKIVWSFPFGIVLESQNKDLKQWPQIIVVVYGTDYFGRSMPRGYGNVHLPTSQGIHTRKIRIFRPLQPTTFFWSCLNFMTNSILEIKQPEHFLGQSAERKNLKVQYSGEIQLEIDTKRINLEMHGYRK